MTSTDTRSVEALWKRYLRATGEDPETTRKTFTAFAFGDHPALADELAELVLAGRKRATAPSVWELEAGGESIPAVGDLGVVLDGKGEACCVVETVAIEIVPYRQVSAAFAAREGEGDGSLAYWRREHWAYYQRILAPYGLEPTESMKIVCESFEVVYP